VGAVGAKLYYPNERIQHAGTILGLGGAAGHAFRHFHRTAPGYCGRLLLTRNLSAVTAACMLLRRSVFEEIGGFDETNLAVAFNDVDLCLRLREKGYRIVWTPFAELYHWESVSRGSDLAPEQIERFRREMKYLTERWRAVIAYDPYYNPNLTVEGEDFDLAFPPRVLPPWVKERFGNADPV
jgi:GT2 family glycosyltransferase